MVDLNQENNNPNHQNNQAQSNLNSDLNLNLKMKKRKALINWLRVIALLFAGFFILSQCAMNKPQAKAKIIQSCIDNVPYAERWKQALIKKNLVDVESKLVTQYCQCMWDEPLQKLSDKQIQSFAKISTQEQLDLLGGEQAFDERDKQCISNLK